MKIETLEPEELDRIRVRLLFLSGIIILIFSLLASRLWFLQISEGQKYADFAKGNRIRLVPEPALRGIVYDRNGLVIAENRPAYQLHLIREDSPDLKKTLKKLSKALDISLSSFEEKVKANKGQARFKPIILEEDLEYEKAMLVETYQDDFPGISIMIQPRRFYPNKNLASHLVGYVGVVQEDWSDLPEEKRSSSQIIGRSGVERIQNDHMVGLDGGRQVEVDHVGRELRILGKPVPPAPGKNVHLTLDLRIQEVVHEAMKGEAGAVLVMNPKTGAILALGSFPDFDPNLFSGGIDQENWKRLLENPEHPLENKAIQGLYPPGSIFKIITAYAGLDQGVINDETTHVCNGFFHIKGRDTPFKCWKKGGHGKVNVVDAIKGSCNVFFYHTGVGVGVDHLHEYASMFGLGKTTRLGLMNEKSGLIPSSEWKTKALKERWYLGETPSMAIGQGYISVTPIQVLNMVNIVANHGVVTQPKLFLEDELTPPVQMEFNQEYLNLVRQGMIAVVNEDGGTARKVQFEEFMVAGKTATSQVVSHETLENLDDEAKENKALQNHAWFVAFGPAEDPEISVLVLVEHGGAGSQAAAPIARKIISYYVDNIYDPEATSSLPNKVPAEFAFQNKLHAAFIQ